MKSGKRRAVTIYEIARHVGVSPAAVSSVLANREVERRIARGTVQRIRDAARELGYVPNMAGRRLRAHKVATRQYDLAILTSFEAPLPLVSQALHALQLAMDAAAQEDTRYAVAIEMFHAGRLREKPGLLDANRYHGVIITNTLPADDDFLRTASIPYAVVIIGRRIAGHCCVLEQPDFVGRRAAEVLLDVGSTRLAVLHGRMLTQATSDRVHRFIETVQQRLGRAPAVLVSEGLISSDGNAALRDYFAKGGRCDGIFCVTDSLTVGAYQAIRDAGKRIPKDVAVVGVGDYEIAEFFDPPLSTVAGANEAMVTQAVPLLFDQLHGRADVPAEVLVVPPVYLRESTQR